MDGRHSGSGWLYVWSPMRERNRSLVCDIMRYNKARDILFVFALVMCSVFILTSLEEKKNIFLFICSLYWACCSIVDCSRRSMIWYDFCSAKKRREENFESFLYWLENIEITICHFRYFHTHLFSFQFATAVHSTVLILCFGLALLVVGVCGDWMVLGTLTRCRA